MRSSNVAEVLTYIPMYHLRQYFIGYNPRQQYDAEECLRTIRQVCYPDVN